MVWHEGLYACSRGKQSEGGREEVCAEMWTLLASIQALLLSFFVFALDKETLLTVFALTFRWGPPAPSPFWFWLTIIFFHQHLHQTISPCIHIYTTDIHTPCCRAFISFSCWLWSITCVHFAPHVLSHLVSWPRARLRQKSEFIKGLFNLRVCMLTSQGSFYLICLTAVSSLRTQCWLPFSVWFTRCLVDLLG